LANIVRNIVPGLAADDVLSARRITPRKTNNATTDTTTSTNTNKPRLVCARMSSKGKQHLLEKRKEAKYMAKAVFVQHDLTRLEQERR